MEEEENEHLRALGMGTWKKVSKLVCLSTTRPTFFFGIFSMPPMPVVLSYSLLSLMMCKIVVKEVTIDIFVTIELL